MPTPTRWYIRTALLHLIAAFLIGGLVWANQSLDVDPRLWVLLPIFYHLLMVGWATQLIAGVALWMFPLRSRDQPRGDARLAWVAYGALNSGLVLRAIGEPIHSLTGQWGWVLALSALLQIAAIWVIVAALWPRVKGRRAAQ